MTAEGEISRRDRPGLTEAVLLFTQGLIAVTAVFLVYQVGIISPGCSPACDYELFTQINLVFRWVVGSIFCATVIAILASWAIGRRSRWAPLAGIIVTIIATIWATIAGVDAFTV